MSKAQLFHANAQRHALRGFTLTEMAIVLGIIGIILGAIWAAAAQVYENNRTKMAVSEILTIVNNWRSVYANQRMDTGGAWLVMNTASIQNKFVPDEMLIPGTFNLSNPWNPYASVNIYTYDAWNVIRVDYNGLSQSACVRLASAISTNNLVWEDISGTSVVFPPLVPGPVPYYTVPQISALCNKAGTGNDVGVAYSI